MTFSLSFCLACSSRDQCSPCHAAPPPSNPPPPIHPTSPTSPTAPHRFMSRSIFKLELHPSRFCRNAYWAHVWIINVSLLSIWGWCPHRSFLIPPNTPIHHAIALLSAYFGCIQGTLRLFLCKILTFSLSLPNLHESFQKPLWLRVWTEWLTAAAAAAWCCRTNTTDPSVCSVSWKCPKSFTLPSPTNPQCFSSFSARPGDSRHSASNDEWLADKRRWRLGENVGPSVGLKRRLL